MSPFRPFFSLLARYGFSRQGDHVHGSGPGPRAPMRRVRAVSPEPSLMECVSC
ncbi:hypothetical protein [Lysobacter gummosus]|uniref:hypothetical protein n=1 Tax=Lysobacter gummosus TaxID=262324 RepID=UPI003637A9FE